MRASRFILALIASLTFWLASFVEAPPNSRVATGRLHLVFTERSPLSAPETVAGRMHVDRPGAMPASDTKAADYDLASESFDIFVPANYKSNVPHGLLVWMG